MVKVSDTADTALDTLLVTLLYLRMELLRITFALWMKFWLSVFEVEAADVFAVIGTVFTDVSIAFEVGTEAWLPILCYACAYIESILLVNVYWKFFDGHGHLQSLKKMHFLGAILDPPKIGGLISRK